MRKRKKPVKIENQKTEVKKELDYIPLGKCKSCKRAVKDSDFKDDVDAYNQFATKGLCKRCQIQTDALDENLEAPLGLSGPLEHILEQENE
jgi:hypothetical protein